MSATLYIVPTPIGNLEDMTLRAIRVLKEVDLILCEDTSVAQKLLKHYAIETKTSNFFAQSSHSKIEKVLGLLEEGQNIALISDAGTPTISDPGVILIDAIRRALPEVAVVPLPGSSALITALSGSGITSSSFIFLGFFPHKKGRETLYKEIGESTRTIVFYESVHRIEKTLEQLTKYVLGSRLVCVCKELSKMHEEIVRGSSDEVLAYFTLHKDKVRGEFVVIIEAKQ